MVPIPAATVILLREGLEVFLLKRHRKSSFMSNTFVFPGGKIDPEDASPQVAAIRELFEEAGVLLTTGPQIPTTELASARKALNANTLKFTDFLTQAGQTPDLAKLHWWSRWVTPSAEPKRFDAQFFLAELPAGQTPSFDDKETVEELWATPAEALARHARKEIMLPPPQLRTLMDLLPYSLSQAIAAAAERERHPHPITPRFAQVNDLMTLLLPWDPEYVTLGSGEGTATPDGHLLATGHSRFVLHDGTWRMVTPTKPGE